MVEEPLPPMVKAPLLNGSRLPEPPKAPSAALKPLRFRVPPVERTVQLCRAVALFSLRTPALSKAIPVKLFVPPNKSVPVPACSMLPLPEISAEKHAPLSERSKTKRPLSRMLPTTPPVVPLLPNCRVPALIVVPPL